jgi:hypothetical protein
VEKPQEPKLKMLYGRDLKEYENVDVENLLSQLSADELAQLSEEVDPDDNLLPPSQRCKDQTSKSATGPLNRKKLLTFLTKFAAEQEDWPELKQFQPGVKRGMPYLSPVFVCVSTGSFCEMPLHSLDHTVNSYYIHLLYTRYLLWLLL